MHGRGIVVVVGLRRRLDGCPGGVVLVQAHSRLRVDRRCRSRRRFIVDRRRSIGASIGIAEETAVVGDRVGDLRCPWRIM